MLDLPWKINAVRDSGFALHTHVRVPTSTWILEIGYITDNRDPKHSLFIYTQGAVQCVTCRPWCNSKVQLSVWTLFRLVPSYASSLLYFEKEASSAIAHSTVGAQTIHSQLRVRQGSYEQMSCQIIIWFLGLFDTFAIYLLCRQWPVVGFSEKSNKDTVQMFSWKAKEDIINMC